MTHTDTEIRLDYYSRNVYSEPHIEFDIYNMEVAEELINYLRKSATDELNENHFVRAEIRLTAANTMADMLEQMYDELNNQRVVKEEDEADGNT